MGEHLPIPEIEYLPWATVQPREDGTFEPAEDGLLCKQLQIYDADDDLVDVVAWRFGAPSPWWLRYGVATVLGEDELSRAWWANEPVRLAETPDDWLARRGRAVCLLRWDIDPYSVLRGCDEVICATPALRRRLENRIAELSRPRFKIREAA